ncbi:hypothetical protein RHMOL_Rhmol04G0322700 [Rhododendron molle]|uniref:Uncharacterized protein n=1 Tax=Rhododendron molle TaxID=49168 RepID=A0ACC0P871_RHOML|nr:hypothetical protein RHMOL_Rhmol04G0322700 [Rhododendron molle]
MGRTCLAPTISSVDNFGSSILTLERRKSQQKWNKLGSITRKTAEEFKKENKHIDLSLPAVRFGPDEDVNYEGLTTALRKAVRLHCAIQASDGHWPAEHSGPMFITPALPKSPVRGDGGNNGGGRDDKEGVPSSASSPWLIIILYISGTISTFITEAHRKELIRFGYLHQNDDGGWGFHLEGHSTMIGTALNYVALRLLGEGLDDGENRAMTRAREWIIGNGGATGIPSWGKLYLSVLGVYEWSGCNPLPPEFWLFPSFSPYHPGKMWCYCRTAYMPMSYLYGRKYHGPITDLVKSLRREIHTTPYEEIDWNKARHNCCKADLYYPHVFIQDVLWDCLHYLASKTFFLLQSLQMMCWWAEEPNGDEFKNLARVPDWLWLAEDGMKMQSLGSALWDCAFTTQALLSSRMIDECLPSLKKAHFYMRESQVRENPNGDFKSMYRHMSKGAWCLSDQDNGWAVSDCTAEALKCLLLFSQMPPEFVGEKVDEERLYVAVNFLLYVQSPISGGFAIWEPPIPQPYMQALNPLECFADIVIEIE